MIGLTLLGGVALGLMTFTSKSSKEKKTAYSEAMIKKDMSLLQQKIRRNLLTGDIRFISFVKQTTGLTPNLTRVIIPMPGVCSNLDPSCGSNTSILYTKYDRSRSPMINVMCRLGRIGAPTDEDYYNPPYLVDLNDSSMETSVLDPKGFKVSATSSLLASGIIEIQADMLVANYDPPVATIWRVVEAPTHYNSVDLNTPPPEFTDVCKNNLQNQTPPPTDKLYKIRLEPLVLGNFTTNDLDISDISISEKSFPIRLTNVALESFGLIPHKDSYRLTFFKCTVVGTPDVSVKSTVNCQDQYGPFLDNVTHMSIYEKFKIKLDGASTDIFYEIIKQGDEDKISCIEPNICDVLSVVDINDLPVHAESASGTFESPGVLFGEDFSIFKQLELSEVIFNIKIDKFAGDRKIYVSLP